MSARKLLSLPSIIVLTICTFLFGMGQFHRAAGAIVAQVWQEQYALNSDQLGFVISVIFVVNIIAQGFIGTLLDKIGPRKIISLFLLILAGGTLACIFATGFVSLVVARILLGLGLSVGGVGMYMLLARNFAPEQFGFLNGLMVTLGGIGGLLATYPLAFTISQFGWQTVFTALAGFTVLLSGAIFLTSQKDPVAEKKSAAKITFLDLLRNKDLRPVLVMASVIWAPITAITGLWGGPYFKAVHHFSLEETGLFQMLFFCATMASGTVFGLIDRWVPVSRYRVILSAAGISIGSLTLLALLPGLSYGPAILLLVMIFAQQFYVPLIAQLRAIVPEGVIGRATSLYTIIAVAAIPTFQTLFGIVIEHSGDLPDTLKYRLGFGMMAVLILIPTVYFGIYGRKALHDP